MVSAIGLFFRNNIFLNWFIPEPILLRSSWKEWNLATGKSTELNYFNWIVFSCQQAPWNRANWKLTVTGTAWSDISRKLPLTTGCGKQSREGRLYQCNTAEFWMCSSWPQCHGYHVLPHNNACKRTCHQISLVLAAPWLNNPSSL